MHKTMTATALSFLLAIAGGGIALANTNAGTQGSSSSGSASSQTTGSQGSNQQGTQANGQAPVGFAEEEVTSAPFTIQSVDKKNRNVVLRAQDGTQSTVSIPTGTPGFDTLKKGDKVQLDYFAAAVFGPGNQQANRASQGGSMPSNGSTSGTNNIGRVRNIRKMNHNGSSNSSTSSNSDTGSSGNTHGSGAQGSGSEQGNQ